MYPTFVEMCGLSPVDGLEGTSLAGALREPSMAIDRDVFLPYLTPGGYAIINQKWRYIHYDDDTEELYDVQRDPHEWDNLAENVDFAVVKRKLQASGPRSFAPAGTPKKQLRLIVGDERFHWELKSKKNGNP